MIKEEQQVRNLAFYALMIDEHLRTSQSKTVFQLINRLSIVHIINRRRHYEVLLDYIK